MTPNLSRDERIVTPVASVGVLALAAYFRSAVAKRASPRRYPHD